ncbi:MAG: hypothetical protein ACI4F2_04150 [Acutalibacteraceae bacterium]
MANTYIPDRWLDKLESLPAKDYKILLSAIFRGEDEPEISAKHQHIADEIYQEINKKNRQTQATRKCRDKHYGNITVRLQPDYSNITVMQEEKKEKDSPPSPPSSSPPHPLNNTPYNPPLEREKREDSPSSLTLTNPQGGDTSGEKSKEFFSIRKMASRRFDNLWEMYPRKMGKKRAFEAYLRAVKRGVTDAVIQDGIERYTAYLRAEKISPQYIKLGSTWFCGQCWNDEYNVSTQQLTPDEEREYQEIWGGG